MSTDRQSGGKHLRTRFEHEVEWGLAGSAEAAEARFLENGPQSLLTSLGTQCEPDALGQRVGRTDERGGGIVHPTNGRQIVLQLVAGERFHEKDRAVILQDVTGMRR